MVFRAPSTFCTFLITCFNGELTKRFPTNVLSKHFVEKTFCGETFCKSFTLVGLPSLMPVFGYYEQTLIQIKKDDLVECFFYLISTLANM